MGIKHIADQDGLEVLKAAVLLLPPVERPHLLERLIASLDSNPKVEDAWEQEADHRKAELGSGSNPAISGHFRAG